MIQILLSRPLILVLPIAKKPGSQTSETEQPILFIEALGATARWMAEVSVAVSGVNPRLRIVSVEAKAVLLLRSIVNYISDTSLPSTIN